MLTVKQCEDKLEELRRIKSLQSGATDISKEYIEYLSRLEVAYRKELADAYARIPEDYDLVASRPKSTGMYR